MSNPITVTLIEDDISTLQHLVTSLREDGRFDLIAACDSFEEASRALDAEAPRVLVTDLKLPDGHGFDLIVRARREMATTEIMVISTFGDERTVVKAIGLGASGYLMKDTTPFDIREAVSDLVCGRSPISTSVARHIIRSLQLDDSRDGWEPARPSLTGRELDILWGIAKGFSYKEIAQRLDISPHTVPTHIKNIYRKLDVHSRCEAVFEAVQSGLITLN